ncbi:hypothetical protein ATCC90586_005432 [Pythium insidiosum]|nr:hypothetical protein ATCC90586_005432 [Pythium insidiosum]
MPKANSLPARHPRRLLESRNVQLALLILAPFLCLFLVIWGLLGLALTMSPVAVAIASTVTTWTLYLAVPGIPMRVIDLPIVLTALYVTMAVIRRQHKLAHATMWLVATVYGISRAVTFDASDATTQRNFTVLAVLSAVFPTWILVTQLRLWLPADKETLEKVEHLIYSKYIVTEFSAHQVAGLGTVHVPYCGDNTRLPPRTLVLVHGYMAGNAFWAANLQTLAKFFNVYAVEWMGIGRSDRPSFKPKNEREMDAFFVESLEEWRRAMHLDRFVLCGHSMGGMYTSYYADVYPQFVEHLILVSPAGVNASGLRNDQLPWVLRTASKYYITPMSLVRFAGPFGLSLVQWILKKRIAWTPETNIIRSGDMDFEHITMYCYHNWALKPSGEIALYTHLHPGAAAQRRPLNEVLAPAKLRVPVSFLYGGGGDWMPSEHGEALVRQLQNSHYATLRLVPSAGHQVFMDNPSDFNQMLIDAVHEYDRAPVTNLKLLEYHATASPTKSLPVTPPVMFRSFATVAVLALASIHSAQSIFHDFSVGGEPVDREVTAYDKMVAGVALQDKRNFAPQVGEPICIQDVYRTREGTDEKGLTVYYFEAKGCRVAAPVGFCRKPCNAVPFEVVVTSPTKTQTYDPLLKYLEELKRDRNAKSPFVVESIGILL